MEEWDRELSWQERWLEHSILDDEMEAEEYEFEVALHYLGPDDHRTWTCYYGGWRG